MLDTRMTSGLEPVTRRHVKNAERPGRQRPVGRRTLLNAARQALFKRENSFALVIGLTDGILTALTLTAGRMLDAANPITLELALRISIAAAISGVVVYFTAEYVRLRGELVQAERQLNLARHGHLATTHLGHVVFRDAVRGAISSSTCTLVGALLPLLAGVLLTNMPWASVAVSLVALGVLGTLAARATYANPLTWSLALVTAGCLLTVAGLQLRVV
jgi:predicted membrane protein (TIGR00267 family)